MQQPTNKYWDSRAMARMATYHKGADRTINTITTAYDKAVSDINAEIEKIFSKYAKDGILTPDAAKELLNQPISSKELDVLRVEIQAVRDPRIQRQLLNKLNAPAYSARITRLQALKERVYIESKKIADVEIQASTLGYIDTINDAYYKNLFDIQKGLGIGFDVAAMPSKSIEAILKNPWSGEHFSKRVWGNTDVLANKINEVITAGFKSGASIQKMSQEIEDMSTLGKFAATRLVRTETTYMANAGEMESYAEADIDQYMFMATLDNRTSELCQEHDNKVYNVKDAVPGENMPPLHPYCRSTTRAWFGEDTLKGIQRRARDPATGETYFVPADMTYNQWYKKHVVDGYGQDQADIMKKKVTNETSDRKQYEKYKTILGDDVPKSFANFQELKYNKPREWEDSKGLYRYIKNNPESDKLHYEINKDIQKLISDGKVSETIGTAAKPIPVDYDNIHKHALNRMNQRNVTKANVTEYIHTAKVMFKQNGGAKNVYYSDLGSASVMVEEKLLVTVFPSSFYDDGAKEIMEVLKKHGK